MKKLADRLRNDKTVTTGLMLVCGLLTTVSAHNIDSYNTDKVSLSAEIAPRIPGVVVDSQIPTSIEISTAPEPILEPEPEPVITTTTEPVSFSTTSTSVRTTTSTSITYTNSGITDDVWWELAGCETGYKYDNPNTGNGYYGYFQFSATTWWSIGESGYAHQYSYEYQKAGAIRLQARSGWGQWPACSRLLRSKGLL